MRPYYRGPLRTIGPESLEGLESSGAWIAEEKYDGHWARIMVERGSITRILGRSGEDLDRAWWAVGLAVGPPGCAGELHGESMRDDMIRLWDVVSWADRSLEETSLEQRRAILEVICAGMPVSARRDLRIAPRLDPGWRDQYQRIVGGGGGEGLVLKLRGSTLSTRRRDGKLCQWAKIKPLD